MCPVMGITYDLYYHLIVTTHCAMVYPYSYHTIPCTYNYNAFLFLFFNTQTYKQLPWRHSLTSMGFFPDLISPISDPEHPLSLGELAVVNLPHIKVTDKQDRSAISHVLVEITPTITHCSLATVIGLGIRVRLEQALPPRFRLDVRIREGTHTTADQVNKQLNDKERVAAACENESLMAVLRKMLETCR